MAALAPRRPSPTRIWYSVLPPYLLGGAFALDRARLGPGDHIDGPAIITSSTPPPLLLLGQTDEIHPLGSLVMHDRSPFRSVQDSS